MQHYSTRIKCITPLLGSAPMNESVYMDYIASKAPVSNGNGAVMVDELERVEAVDEKGRTGFLRDEDGRPLLMDYHLKGFFKEAWRALKSVPLSESKDLKAGIAAIDRYVFIEPRFVTLHPAGAEGIMERPLRAQTMQGPRVALASSEKLPTGTWFDAKITVLAPQIVTEALLREWLGYGEFLGLGQWRSGGYGRFTATLKPWTAPA